MFTTSKRILGLIGFAGSIVASVNAPVYLKSKDESFPRHVAFTSFEFAGGCRPTLSYASNFEFPMLASASAKPKPLIASLFTNAKQASAIQTTDDAWVPEETSTPAPVEEKEAAIVPEEQAKRRYRLSSFSPQKAMTVNDIARLKTCKPGVIAKLNALKVTDVVAAKTKVLLFDGKLEEYKVRSGDSLWHIHKRFQVHTACLLFSNRMKDTRIWPGQTLLIPEGRISEDSRKAIKKLPQIRRLLAPKHYVLRPVPGRITSPFGWRTHPILKRRGFHTGIDISAPKGTPIRAIASATVRRSGNCGPLGLCVILNHSDGKHKSYYGHCSKLLVKVGDVVPEGAVIALVGRTGRATGSHLHFGIKRGRHFVNPTRNLDLWTRGPRPTCLAKR